MIGSCQRARREPSANIVTVPTKILFDIKKVFNALLRAQAILPPAPPIKFSPSYLSTNSIVIMSFTTYSRLDVALNGRGSSTLLSSHGVSDLLGLYHTDTTAESLKVKVYLVRSVGLAP